MAGGTPKAPVGNLHSRKLRQMQDGGFILDMRKIRGARNLLLVAAVDNRKLREFETPILLEGEINGLWQGQP